MSEANHNGSGSAGRKPTLDELESIEYDTEDVGYGRLLLWPALAIAALLVLALGVSRLNFLGPY